MLRASNSAAETHFSGDSIQTLSPEKHTFQEKRR
nr:MAG TPA: hypothetical protein [Caudoviricetes sp.]